MIVNARYGQLSNRLTTIAYALASAIEFRCNIRLTEFDDLKDNYECKVGWPQKVKIKGSLLWGLERDLYQWIKKRFKRLRIPRVVSDWSYRNENGVERQANLLRDFFRPKAGIIQDAMTFHAKVFDGDVLMIGVHVRRGDYAKWAGGKYFYGDDVYSRNMRSIERELAEKGKRARFVIFSSEPVNLANYNLESEVFKSDFNAIQDHWLMGKCDYIMGPPSTFSLWAAFMGKTLLAFIEDANTNIRLSDFSFHGLKIYC